MLALGSLSSLGVGTEDPEAYGTGVDPVYFLPISQESLDAPRESIESTALSGDRMISNVALGIKAVSGGFTLVNDASSLGICLLYWNGATGYAHAALTTLTASTVASAGATAGGSLTAGTYYYKVASVYTRTVDGMKFIGPASPSSAAIVTASSNLTVPLTWTNGAGSPGILGLTLCGAVVYRTAAGGANTTQKFVKYVSGTGATFADDGVTATLSDSNFYADPLILPSTNSLYAHAFIGTPPTSGTDPLPSFSATVTKNNDYAERYVGLRMNEFRLTAGGGNNIMEAAFTVFGKTSELVPNEEAPDVPLLEPILGWKGAAFIDDSTSCEIMESFEIQCSNRSEQVPGFCASPYNREVASGIRQIMGNFKRNFDDHRFWLKVQSGAEFSIKINAYGQPNTSTGASLNLADHGVDAIPFPFFMEIELFRCKTPKAGGNIKGQGRIPEQVDFKAYKSATYGTEMRIRLWNTVASWT